MNQIDLQRTASKKLLQLGCSSDLACSCEAVRSLKCDLGIPIHHVVQLDDSIVRSKLELRCAERCHESFVALSIRLKPEAIEVAVLVQHRKSRGRVRSYVE